GWLCLDPRRPRPLVSRQGFPDRYFKSSCPIASVEGALVGNKDVKDGDLFDMLRATGLRKKVARTVSASAARMTDEQSRIVHKTAQSLRTAASALDGHAPPRHGVTSGGVKKANSRATSGNKRTAPRRSVSKRTGASKDGARSRSEERRVGKEGMCAVAWGW